MSTWEIILQLLVTGLANGLIIALIALGYTMVYGIVELINFAHGDVMMLGCFLALTIVGLLGGEAATPWLAIGLMLLLVPLGGREVGPAEAVGAVQGGAVGLVLDRQRRGGAGPLGRVELVDEDVDVLAGAVGGDVAGAGDQADDVEVGVVEGEGDGEGGIDPGVGDEDHFPWHGAPSLAR